MPKSGNIRTPEDAIFKDATPLSPLTKVTLPPKSNDWGTPPELIEKLDTEFHFTLEVCASENNRAIDHVPYMGLDNGQDALTHCWGDVGEVCYCNPPYSLLPAFIKMGTIEGISRTVVMLLPAYTDTRAWWDYIVMEASEVRFLKGRLAFLMNGCKQSTAKFPSAVVVWKPRHLEYFPTNSPSIGWWDWRA